MGKLSVVLATRNEEENIGPCLESVKTIADDIVVVDEESTDKTREIAKKYGARVFKEPHEHIFHITKQKALDKAVGDWILQLDADERVTPKLAKEIKLVVDGKWKGVKNKKKLRLFKKHQNLIEERDGKIGKESSEVVGYFIPRRNMFLGKSLIRAGVYPDGVIRLVKKGKAEFPQKSVHEQISLDGKVDWLENDLEHHDSPTFERYLSRANRYTDHTARELGERKVPKNIFYLIHYSFSKPFAVFLKLYFWHKGFLDGMRGFVWSLFSGLHFAIAYFKYWEKGAKG